MSARVFDLAGARAARVLDLDGSAAALELAEARRDSRPTIDDVVREVSAGTLVDVVIRLTHQVADEAAGEARPSVLAGLREQRAIARAELVRRCGS